MGDFNNYLDPIKDKLTDPYGQPPLPKSNTAFACLLGKLGLMDVWRMKYTNVRKCSASHGGLSRIDLGLGNEEILPSMLSSLYEPRGVSDHSPFRVELTIRAYPR